jgi:hypothetical protein
VAKNYELEDTPEQLLARAYALRGNDSEETQRLYSDWAETYDQTMLGGLSLQLTPADRSAGRRD